MAIETPHADWRHDHGVIDMHTHIAADHVDEALQVMERTDIEAMVDIGGGNVGERWDEFASAIEDHPDRFAAFTGLDFDGFGESGWVDREIDRVEEAMDGPGVGVKVHKALGLEYTDENGDLVPVDDDRLAPVIERVGELGGVFAFHTADPKAFFEPLGPENERWEELEHNPHWHRGDRDEYPYQWWQLIRQLENVIERHDDTTILGVHWGCAAEEVGYVADIMRDNPNYVLDVSARLGEIGRHEADVVHDVFAEFPDRIMFGTDLGVRDPIMLGAPQDFEPTLDDVEAFYDAHWHYFETDEEGIAHPTPIQGDWTVDAIDLPREVLEKFYVENARRILGL